MSNQEIETLRSRVVMARGYKGLTQSDLADLAAIDQSQLSKFENGKLASPSLAMILALAKALNMGLDDLLQSDPNIFSRELFSSPSAVAGSSSAKHLPECFHRLGASAAIPKWAIPIGSADREIIAVDQHDLEQHLLLVGGTGSGKTEWLRRVGFGLVRNRQPLLVLPGPIGDLPDLMINDIACLGPEYSDDVTVLDFSDEHSPLHINPLDVLELYEVEAAVEACLEVASFKFDLHGAPRARAYFWEALTALAQANLKIEDPALKLTMMHVLDFFNDREFRTLVVDSCQHKGIRFRYDPDAGPFEMRDESEQREHTEAVTNAILSLKESSTLNRVLTAGGETVSIQHMIANNEVIIVKANRDGAAISALLLSMLLSSVDDWGRDIDSITGVESGHGCQVLLDEALAVFQSGTSLTGQLHSAQRRGVSLLMATHYIGHGENQVSSALMNEIGTVIALRQAWNHARHLAARLPEADQEQVSKDIASLPHWQLLGWDLTGTNENSPQQSFQFGCLPALETKLSESEQSLAYDLINRNKRFKSVSASEEALTATDRRKAASQVLRAILQKEYDDKIHSEAAIDQFSSWNCEPPGTKPGKSDGDERAVDSAVEEADSEKFANWLRPEPVVKPVRIGQHEFPGNGLPGNLLLLGSHTSEKAAAAESIITCGAPVIVVDTYGMWSEELDRLGVEYQQKEVSSVIYGASSADVQGETWEDSLLDDEPATITVISIADSVKYKEEKDLQLLELLRRLTTEMKYEQSPLLVIDGADFFLADKVTMNNFREHGTKFVSLVALADSVLTELSLTEAALIDEIFPAIAFSRVKNLREKGAYLLGLTPEIRADRAEIALLIEGERVIYPPRSF